MKKYHPSGHWNSLEGPTPDMYLRLVPNVPAPEIAGLMIRAYESQWFPFIRSARKNRDFCRGGGVHEGEKVG